ncbi:MAG: miniconductance mechanosensitive channel [Arenicella sp.]|jgi:miniconductance mechanosensitive channel
MAIENEIVSDSLNQTVSQASKLHLQAENIVTYCNDTLGGTGLKGDALIYARTIGLGLLVVGASFFLWWITRKLTLHFIHRIADKTKTTWDDELVKNKFFSACAHLVPLLLMDYFMHVVFYDFQRLADIGVRLTDFVIIFVLIIIVMRFMNTARDVLSVKPQLKDKPIHSFFQLGKIIVGILFGFLMISVAFNVDLVVILTSMGAMTAVILLVFKDTILGFVGSIQLAANDMVRIGDWVTMERYGADGDVLEITLATVKVQNFDKTITTIPTYSFISDSFKNWRGMEESGGRRVTRSLNIQISSIKFCTPEMLNKYGEIEMIRSYVEDKEKQIADFNLTNEVNKKMLLNGRSQTNIGIFRHYVECYLKENKDINQDMTLMVRQLAPTEKGVALQVYAFTHTKVWVDYEVVLGDLFDHLMAAVPFFDLSVFESPSGKDFKSLSK